ncbi:hypothetical protein B0T26DRAFT_648799 [Lasiosphaeria miniovina]|uniref:Neprosin PEP catalytic domain-containing protein n=1 Tax=Lasiosphaeria miniovina TaxID=1954250 RepID=A0AA40AD82_9PEZI|nr:uncharacterized protein B0T26DRAFT_648799 [Lasiosphaeria miniovina]KAK0713742.1 hypothetical protein B0T26DRAFT_648799 [Lasiosphaeria miniovina]
MRHSIALALYSAVAGVGVSAAPAAKATDKPVSFAQFLGSTSKTSFESFSAAGVRDSGAFKQMTDHIQSMYSGVKDPSKVTSFKIDDTYGDCIPVQEQPSVHLLGLGAGAAKLATPPSGAAIATSTSAPKGLSAATKVDIPSILSLGVKDVYGNSISCPPGTVPVQRLTPESLARYGNLTDFFYKPRAEADGGTGDKEIKTLGKRAGAHSYARAIDTVLNFGGNAWMNLWSPSGYFSISQHWYVVNVPHQTVEGGWAVNHQKWDGRARLFIYWTADDYQHTGCWNLDCAGFVQTSNKWYLGGPFDRYSVYAGGQVGFELQWKLYKGNWWLFLKANNGYESVGYYPAKIYGNGPITKHADYAKWGGETAPDSSYGQMGSGHFPAEGFGKAAYQNNIFTIPRDESGGYGVQAALSSLHITKPSCYTIATTPRSGSSWGSYFYFGGPGGKTCA